MHRLTHLQALEAESIHILREVATEFQRPVMLYSIGKDSSVMLRLAQKAFHPGPIPFPLLHVDTGYKFREMIEFRDAFTARLRVEPGESIRVFPLSNWTELDVWHYIHLENIPVVPMYFAQDREVLVRGEQLISLEQPFVPMLPGEKPKMVRSRMRSLGCSPCTGAIRSDADTVPKIIEELIGFRKSERENRVIDHDQEGSMEIKKREGYF